MNLYIFSFLNFLYFSLNIKKYQLWICSINLTVIPVSWYVLAVGFAPYWVLVYKIITSIALLVYRVYYLSKKIDFPQLRYYSQIVLRLLVIMPLITIPELYWISELFNGWNKIIVVTFSSFILVPIIFYLIALDTSERTIVISYVKSKISCK